MRIDHDGFVGIGTTSPTVPLEVVGTISGSDVYAAESVRVTMTDGTTQRALSQQSGVDLQMGDAGINDLTFKNAVGTAVTMKNDGKVGIGNNSPTEELVVAGDISASGDLFLQSNKSLALNNQNNNNFSYIRNYGTNVSDISLLVGGSGTANQMMKLQTGGVTINSAKNKPSANKLGVFGSIYASGSDGHITASGQAVFGGNVGIGSNFVSESTPSYPQSKLHLSGSTANDSGIRQSRAGSKIWTQQIDSSGRLQWATRATEAGASTTTFTLDDNGRVGIGSGAPKSRLHVSSSSGGGDVHIDFSSNTAKGIAITPATSSGGWARYYGFASSSLASKDYYGGFGGYGTDEADFTRWFVGYYGSAHEIVSFTSSSRRVGIGNIHPTEKLTVHGNISSSGHLYLGTEGAGGTIYGRRDGTGNESYMTFGSNITIAADGVINFKETDADPDVTAAFVNVNTGQISSSGAIHTKSHITASGNISSSGTITANVLSVAGGAEFNSSEGIAALQVNGDTDQTLIVANPASAVDLVGIGRTPSNGGEKLQIEGGIRALGNISSSYSSTGSFGRVEASQFSDDGTNLNVPDYVFETNYVLKSLSEVEQHISESKHLPNIPSMEDTDSWSELSYGDRDMKLLEKIEELTLYIISLQKQINELKQNN
tara:strand:+ start:1 stop:1971 length:1971 start_codon:yes stop_codon:yes gene_type:complete